MSCACEIGLATQRNGHGRTVTNVYIPVKRAVHDSHIGGSAIGHFQNDPVASSQRCAIADLDVRMRYAGASWGIYFDGTAIDATDMRTVDVQV